MECGYSNEGKFHQVVLTIKEKIEKHDLSKWKDIVKPEEGPKYDEYFERLLREGNQEKDKNGKDTEGKDTHEKNTHDEGVHGKDDLSAEQVEKTPSHEYQQTEDEENPKKFQLNKEFFDKINNKEKFYFLLNIKEMMETSWLLAQKRLEGIKVEEKSKSVNVQDLLNYSQKIADTTCAPPECDNINDRIMHQEYYPNYHFLNFVNVEEIHLSKLFQLQKYSTVCFPPIITIQEGKDNMLVLHISCSTPHATIYYKVNDETNEQIYNTDEKPKIRKRKKINVYAWSVKNGHIKSRISCISKSYKVEEDDSFSLSDNFPNKDQGEQPSGFSKTGTECNAPGSKPSQITNVFKNLGFLLSRKKEKTEESSSNGDSSSEA
ncbi:conserved Plasmodium protein, unknown function [Plasmodium knowlesi strain H]|uniref:Uncharacterized protein n=3 Tax=Plasmodium knowlesi TaxID=5850 RepID=A0A5K1U1Q8_PLAKH|nr:mediator of RNA polymerase II transcription subunit 4, putative [Plasmodium knowlesi strain H]OTN65281.1 Uncharacterized protein PKNOH_S110086800 [Plasmodium knowlesi]CAA9989489.1 mediator of RNA polymerase II transcription subunit 4, putative [Plasmodium knowlesi strain H]SBO25160.1 conserved Plasmodium protein, unknown function [Plasmodium knowlesi strain H]SBO27783.1 conserved Plasmodium protein, unknown function [Plasmodium knowlesi strain H]VVS78963.1 mediator of RNA polymerase II tran|eukprot:XP_002260214.1 hypothetical protein, conserved in Plasmodium species [Plasmodium knowlesi strain H]